MEGLLIPLETNNNSLDEIKIIGTATHSVAGDEDEVDEEEKDLDDLEFLYIKRETRREG